MKAYKALKSDLTSKRESFQFEIGKKYSVKGKVALCKNGFHACEKLEDVFGYYHWDSRIFEVELEGDIEQGENKVAARHCTLIREITEEVKNSEEIALKVIEKHPWVFQCMQNPSETIRLAAVKKYGNSIEYIKNPSKTVMLAAVKENGYAIQHIKNPSEEVQLAAVKKYGNAIAYIKKPSEAVQLTAVQQDGYAIQFIRNPSEAVQLVAVKQNGYAIEYLTAAI